MEILFLLSTVLWFYFLLQYGKKSKITVQKVEKNYLKEKGDLYEKFIGQIFEKKGDLVIYNGFIRGYADGGVDIIVISMKKKTIELIQCKDWTKKEMFLKDIEMIYKKLNAFKLSSISHTPKSVKMHLKMKRSVKDIAKSLDCDKEKFKISKILYMSSTKVMDAKIKKKSKGSKGNTFMYEDMKIVVKNAIIS